MKNTKQNFQRVLQLAFIVLVIFTFVGFVERLRQNLEPNDSEAIFGGRLESGYQFAGYMIGDKGDGDIEVCGAVLINETTAITAAHCVDDNLPTYFNTGQFNEDIADYIEVKEIEIHPNWKNGNGIAADLALLILSSPIVLSEYAVIGTAELNCDYTVVGYGKQDNTSDFYPLRKSADLCIQSTNYSDGSISFKGKDGGLCFGDSGSPIFKSGTNEFITIASRIDACYTRNFGTGADLSEQINRLNINFNAQVLASNQTCGGIDSNNDSLINRLDLADFIEIYGAKCTDTLINYSCGAKDADRSGIIDLIDLSNFAKEFRKGRCN